MCFGRLGSGGSRWRLRQIVRRCFWSGGAAKTGSGDDGFQLVSKAHDSIDIWKINRVDRTELKKRITIRTWADRILSTGTLLLGLVLLSGAVLLYYPLLLFSAGIFLYVLLGIWAVLFSRSKGYSVVRGLLCWLTIIGVVHLVLASDRTFDEEEENVEESSPGEGKAKSLTVRRQSLTQYVLYRDEQEVGLYRHPITYGGRARSFQSGWTYRFRTNYLDADYVMTRKEDRMIKAHESGPYISLEIYGLSGSFKYGDVRGDHPENVPQGLFSGDGREVILREGERKGLIDVEANREFPLYVYYFLVSLTHSRWYTY